MLVNGCFWALGLEDSIKPDAEHRIRRTVQAEHVRQRQLRPGRQAGDVRGHDEPDSGQPQHARSESAPREEKRSEGGASRQSRDE